MNEIQKAAHAEGQNQIITAFQSKKSLDTQTLTHWINSCLARDSTTERKVQLLDRDDDGNLTKTTTLTASRAEMCGYRLLGAFAAIESIRATLDKKGVTFNTKAQHE